MERLQNLIRYFANSLLFHRMSQKKTKVGRGRIQGTGNSTGYIRQFISHSSGLRFHSIHSCLDSEDLDSSFFSIDHVIARTPITIDQIAKYIPVLFVGALWEEINFRALYQERLSWFIPQPIAIFIVSVLFGIGALVQGLPVLVMVDVLLVIVYSILYGIIFARSKNIFVTWIAHFLANLFAIGFVLLL